MGVNGVFDRRRVQRLQLVSILDVCLLLPDFYRGQTDVLTPFVANYGILRETL